MDWELMVVFRANSIGQIGDERKEPRTATITLQLAVGASDFGEELAELGAIFFAGAGFDAAGYVYGVGADAQDGFGDVFGREAAGEDDAVSLGGAAGDGPVGAMAGAAVFTRFCGVEKKRAD